MPWVATCKVTSPGGGYGGLCKYHIHPIFEGFPLVQRIPLMWHPHQGRQKDQQDPWDKGDEHQQLEDGPRGQPVDKSDYRLMQEPKGDNGAEKPTLRLQRMLCL